MLRTPILLCALALPAALLIPRAVEAQDADPPDVSSEVRTTAAGERILVQTVYVDAPVEAVWAAHTTVEGWQSWAAPLAKIDLRVGGLFQTHYGAGAKIGDPGTNTLHIVNYVPNEVLTLHAEIAPNWPEILKERADLLSSVMLFDRLGEDRTRVRVYGIGYTDDPEFDSMIEFFTSANEGLYRKLIEVLEAE